MTVRGLTLTATAIVLCLLGAVAATAALIPSVDARRGPTATRPSASVASSPIAGRRLYVDPNSLAAAAVRTHPGEAARLRRIADVPQARWLTSDNGASTIDDVVRSYQKAAAARSAMAVFVLYALPGRDCSQYSAGGFASPSQYDAWINAVASGLAGHRSVVVVEPDALSQLSATNATTGAACLTSTQQTQRYAMIRYAVDRLTAVAHTSVYVDAGHSQWLSAAEAARRLARVDVARARGFTLNVASFYRASSQIAYGERISALLRSTYHAGHAYYLIDTSRNGKGPSTARGVGSWCNPAGRGLGHTPTSRTTGAHADGYLWIKRPGESDGSCGNDAPASGSWYESYALELIANAGS